MKEKGPYADKKAHVGTKRAHVGTKRGEIGYLSKRNILVWNEIIYVKTLSIARYDRNTKISIFQKSVFGEKGTPIYWKKAGGAAAPLAPPPRRRRPWIRSSFFRDRTPT